MRFEKTRKILLWVLLGGAALTVIGELGNRNGTKTPGMSVQQCIESGVTDVRDCHIPPAELKAWGKQLDAKLRDPKWRQQMIDDAEKNGWDVRPAR